MCNDSFSIVYNFFSLKCQKCYEKYENIEQQNLATKAKE